MRHSQPAQALARDRGHQPLACTTNQAAPTPPSLARTGHPPRPTLTPRPSRPPARPLRNRLLRVNSRRRRPWVERPVGQRASALTRWVPLRGGRNARPVSPGPSGPTRGQAGAPAAAPRASDRPRPPASRRGGTTLTPVSVGPGGIRRRVRASAERGRVQGPGRAEVDFDPRTLPDVLFPSAIPNADPDRSSGIPDTAAAPGMGPSRGPLIPPLMGPSTPPSMGPPGGEGAVGAGLGPFALVRTLAGQGHGQKPPVTLPRYAT